MGLKKRVRQQRSEKRRARRSHPAVASPPSTGHVSNVRVDASSSEIVLTGARLSSAVRCPRQAVFEGVGIVGRDHTVEDHRRFRRGHAIADVTKHQIAADLAAQGRDVEIEVEIPWGDGFVGHADLRVPDESCIVEITTTKDAELPAHKPLQAAGYAVESGSKAAVVISIDPSTGEERSYPVNVDALRPRWEEIKRQVVEGVRDGVVPDRVCRHPGDGPGMFCPYSGLGGHCFQGWVPEVDHPEAPAAFQALADIEDQISTANPARAEQLKQEREDVRAEVLAYVDPGRENVAGGVSVKVTEVGDSERFSLAAMRKAGFDLPEELRAFVKPSGGHARWTVRRLDVA